MALPAVYIMSQACDMRHDFCFLKACLCRVERSVLLWGVQIVCCCAKCLLWQGGQDRLQCHTVSLQYSGLLSFHNKTCQLLLKTSPKLAQSHFGGSCSKNCIPEENTCFFGMVPLVKFTFQGLNIMVLGSLQLVDMKNNTWQHVKVVQFCDKTADLATLPVLYLDRIAFQFPLCKYSQVSVSDEGQIFLHHQMNRQWYWECLEIQEGQRETRNSTKTQK